MNTNQLIVQMVRPLHESAVAISAARYTDGIAERQITETTRNEQAGRL